MGYCSHSTPTRTASKPVYHAHPFGEHAFAEPPMQSHMACAASLHPDAAFKLASVWHSEQSSSALHPASISTSQRRSHVTWLVPQRVDARKRSPGTGARTSDARQKLGQRKRGRAARTNQRITPSFTPPIGLFTTVFFRCDAGSAGERLRHHRCPGRTRLFATTTVTSSSGPARKRPRRSRHRPHLPLDSSQCFKASHPRLGKVAVAFVLGVSPSLYAAPEAALVRDPLSLRHGEAPFLACQFDAISRQGAFAVPEGDSKRWRALPEPSEGRKVDREASCG